MGSDVEVGDVVEPTAEEIPVVMEPRVRAVGGAFASLDVVNISGVFDRRPKFMQTVPVTPRGVFRSAMKLALQEILDGTEAELFLLLPERSFSDRHEEVCRRRAQDDDDDAKRAARATSWCKLVNCQRPDKHWKDLPWHHAHQPR